ncbi:MAG TPA: LysR family transcriptional regulator [Trebonia sp.]|jgi:DNA-binding transcriptional LysR family regulator
MDFEALRWFQDVAGGATVTGTAARSHVTQPALSRALHRLERETGVALFERDGRLLRLTPAGRAFKQHADAILSRYDRAMDEMADAADPDAGIVSLAFLRTLGTWLVPTVLRDYLAQYPRTSFELHQHGEQGLAEALLGGAAELVITSDDPGEPHVRWQRLLTEPLRLAVSPGHSLANRERAALAELRDDVFIVLRPGYGLRTITERLCRQAGFTPAIGFEGEDVETLRGLVTAGLGVSLLPPTHATGPADPGGTTVPGLIEVTDPGCARDIGVAWLAGRPLRPAASRFSRYMINEAQFMYATGRPPGHGDNAFL